MVWISCPRNREDHSCPNEELGSFMSEELIESIIELLPPNPAWSAYIDYCSGACDGALDIEEYDDDPSPPGVSLGSGSYHYVECDKQTCKCELTEKEFDKAAESAHEAYESRMEDYYEERARAMVDGFDY